MTGQGSSAKILGKRFIPHLLQIVHIVHANYREVSIFSTSGKGYVSLGGNFAPLLILNDSQCPLRLCTLTSWWRRAHSFKIRLQEGHQEENDDPWCSPVRTRVLNLNKKDQKLSQKGWILQGSRGISHLGFQFSLIWGSKQCTSNGQDEGSSCFVGLLRCLEVPWGP